MSPQRLLTYTVRGGAAGAFAGGVGSIWGYFVDPPTFFSAWLAGFYFWLSMPLGALALLLIWDLTGGRWESAGRVPLEAMAGTMPLFVLFFLPLLAALPQLYPWTRPEVASGLHNTWYLNLTFFYARAIAYFAIWCALAGWRVLLPGISAAGRRTSQLISGIGLMLLVYTVAYSGIDWVLSTQPHWFSSIFGMIACSTRLIAGICAALLLLLVLFPAGERHESPFEQALPALAGILLAAVIFWMYAEFCQWLIIWEENLHSEIGWYLLRWSMPWGGVIYALVVAHFMIPFLALVWTPAKRNPTVVGSVSAVLLVADAVYVWWLLLPGLQSIHFSWIHPAVLVGMGGIWLLTLAGILRLTSRAERVGQATREGFSHG
jgi:hypothetical protein